MPRPCHLLAASFVVLAACSSPHEEEHGASEAAMSAETSDRSGMPSIIVEGLEARTIGEQADGYLGFVAEAAPDTGDLEANVKHINIKRRALYTEMAVDRRIMVDTVARTTACILIRDRVGVGQAYQLEDDGEWLFREPDAPARLPSFCTFTR